jgi:hypothetical protein
VLDISGEYVRVTSYDGSYQTAVVNPALSVAPPAGTAYKLRRATPLATGTLQAGSTQNLVVLPASFASTDGYYVGTFILLNSGPAVGESRVITAYNGTTKQAVLGTALSAAPGLDDFELESFSYDNQVPLRYTGSRTLGQPVCYVIQLLQLTIPNLVLKVGYGGKISNYPYLYIHFYNDIKHTETIVYGNNPAGALATFRVNMSVVQDPAALSPPNFFSFNTINLLAPQVMKFSPSESIRFRVTLPTGEDLEFITPDNTSPNPVNPAVQITALIGVRMVPTSPKLANSAF